MKPTPEQIVETVQAWNLLKFFPAEPYARTTLMDMLASMVGTVEQLRWLRDTMLNRVGEWHGPAELRNLFCTRFPPADGNEGSGYCSLPGFTPGDIEAEHLSAPKSRYLPKPGDEPFDNRKLLAASKPIGGVQ